MWDSESAIVSLGALLLGLRTYNLAKSREAVLQLDLSLH